MPRVHACLRSAGRRRQTTHPPMAAPLGAESFRTCPRTRSAALPTVLRSGPYRFFFYMADRNEPPHVHVERDGMEAKLWLTAVGVEHPGAFSALELRRIERIVREKRVILLRSWYAYFPI